MLYAYFGMHVKGEELWVEYRTAFRFHKIKIRGRPLLTQFNDHLIARGLNAATVRNVSMTQDLIESLYRKDHIGPSHKFNSSRETSANHKREAQAMTGIPYPQIVKIAHSETNPGKMSTQKMAK